MTDRMVHQADAPTRGQANGNDVPTRGQVDQRTAGAFDGCAYDARPDRRVDGRTNGQTGATRPLADTPQASTATVSQRPAPAGGRGRRRT
jgi:hypothetical protein